MKPRHIIIVLIVAVVAGTILYTVQGSKDQTAYINAVKKEREEKDHYMKTATDSPFANSKESFTGLKYFPPDIKYKVTATLTPVTDRKMVVLGTNDGKEQRYIEYAHAEFDMDGFHNTLLILEGVDIGPIKGKLFLAFGDGTSADETYGAGRYLDVAKFPGSNTITLDFNKAYNPYCAYDDKFSCPLPPRENLLNIPVRAGEKTYR